MHYLKYVLGILVLAYHVQIEAQQAADWSLIDAMYFTVNPAYTVQAPSLTAALTHGRKWRKLNSSPTQSDLGILIPITKERMGVGAHLFSEEVGPLKTNGIALSYGYHFPLQKSGQDRLSLGTAIRLMHLTFDQNHLIVGETGDQLLSSIEGNRLVPPALSFGFHYQTGVAQYGTPVQFIFAGSLARLLPFQDRFNSFSIERPLQWYGLLGLEIAASSHILIIPSLLLSDVNQTTTNYGLRVKVSYDNLGWAMTQYSKAGFLTTQLGINLGAGFSTNDIIELSGSNSWNFGTLSGQIGNSLTFGLTYKKAI